MDMLPPEIIELILTYTLEADGDCTLTLPKLAVLSKSINKHIRTQLLRVIRDQICTTSNVIGTTVTHSSGLISITADRSIALAFDGRSSVKSYGVLYITIRVNKYDVSWVKRDDVSSGLSFQQARYRESELETDNSRYHECISRCSQVLLLLNPDMADDLLVASRQHRIQSDISKLVSSVEEEHYRTVESTRTIHKPC